MPFTSFNLDMHENSGRRRTSREALVWRHNITIIPEHSAMLDCTAEGWYGRRKGGRRFRLRLYQLLQLHDTTYRAWCVHSPYTRSQMEDWNASQSHKKIDGQQDSSALSMCPHREAWWQDQLLYESKYLRFAHTAVDNQYIEMWIDSENRCIAGKKHRIAEWRPTFHDKQQDSWIHPGTLQERGRGRQHRAGGNGSGRERNVDDDSRNETMQVRQGSK